MYPHLVLECADEATGGTEDAKEARSVGFVGPLELF